MSAEEDSDNNTQRFRQYYKYTPKIDTDFKKKYNYYKNKHNPNYKNYKRSRSREKTIYSKEKKYKKSKSKSPNKNKTEKNQKLKFTSSTISFKPLYFKGSNDYLSNRNEENIQ